MVLLKLLGGVFMSLIFFMPEYLPPAAFAICCDCKVGCTRGCTCGCGCGDENGRKVCIKLISKDDNTATFEDQDTHEVFTIPYDDNVLKGKKKGDCGLIKTQTEQVQVCTGFAVEPGQGHGK